MHTLLQYDIAESLRYDYIFRTIVVAMGMSRLVVALLLVTSVNIAINKQYVYNITRSGRASRSSNLSPNQSDKPEF